MLQRAARDLGRAARGVPLRRHRPRPGLQALRLPPRTAGAGSTAWSTTPASGSTIRWPQLQPERLQATLAVNVVGPFLCARCAIPLLEGSPDASIINISSTAGQRGEAFYSAYAASKGALISPPSRGPRELAPGIRVNAVAPGWVERHTDDDLAGAATSRREPRQRCTPPEASRAGRRWSSASPSPATSRARSSTSMGGADATLLKRG